MNPIKRKYRFEGIQALRFFAALIVVVTHSVFYASERLGVGKVGWGAGAVGVDIFFVVSGFVMVISARSLIGKDDGWKVFMKKRLLRLVPLYWSATTLKLVILLLSSGLVLHSTLDWEMIIKSYFFIPSKNSIDNSISPFLGVGWTLIFEMFFYLIFAGALLFKKNIYSFVGAILALFSIASFFRPDDHEWWWFFMDTIILEFYMGMLIGYYTLKDKSLPTSVAVVGLLLSIAYIFFLDKPFPALRIVHRGIPSALLVWSIISLEDVLKARIPSWMTFFGAASYALYLFHPLISPLAPVVLRKIGIGSVVVSVLLSVMLAMVAASILHLWFEKPMNNYLQTVFMPPAPKVNGEAVASDGKPVKVEPPTV